MYRLSRSLVCLVICIFFSSSTYSQTVEYGAWGIATLILPSDTSHRFGMYVEGKVQTQEISFDNYYEHEIKGGFSFAVNNNYTFLIGGGTYTTKDPNNVVDSVINENRIFEQMTLTSNLGRMLFEHRYRAEQRWVNDNYRTSFRYKLSATLPINHKKLKSGTLFLTGFDEISLGLKAYSFERNRISASLGLQVSKSFTMTAGWINEDNNSLVNNVEKDNLLVHLVYQIQRPPKIKPEKKN